MMSAIPDSKHTAEMQNAALQARIEELEHKNAALYHSLGIQMRCSKKDMARIDELEAENQRLLAYAQAVVDVFREECGNTAAVKQMAALLPGGK